MASDTLTERTTPIEAGETAPGFTLTDQDRNEWTLSEALKDGDVVLCFFPMSFSSVCEAEMKCVTDDFQKFRDKGMRVVGISGDSFFVQKAWADSLGLKQTLLADMRREVCKAYGFYWPELNVPSRGTVIVGRDGKVKWVQSREVKQAMNVGDVLAAG